MEIYAKVGDLLTCPYCIMPLYRMRETVTCGDRMDVETVTGIFPVKDPVKDEKVKCHYCMRELNSFRVIKK